jgi:hypothetical protein
MARTILFIGLVGIIGSALFFGTGYSEASANHPQIDPLDPQTEQMIRRATVQITMVREKIQERIVGTTSEGAQRVSQIPVSTFAEGIGTLIRVEGQVVLVTHNHWPQVIGASKPDRVRFHDAKGMLLLEIDGATFQRKILYRDGGTMVLEAAEELVSQLDATESVRSNATVATGDSVYVVRQRPGSEMEVDLLAARVTSIDEYGHHSLMTLQSANGESIEPGDSGGGIWVDGTLVGNMWMTIREELVYERNPEDTEIVVTDRSRAAGLTQSLLELVGESLQIAEELSTMSDAIAME